MLLNLHVKNLALIDEADVEFGGGLNILSGETGAGKSIIIGSMNLALGEKVPKEMLRDSGEDALVELVFSIDNDETRMALENLGVDVSEDTVILSRKITTSRSIGRINGETFSTSSMKAVASTLIDIYGQHDGVSLSKKSKHLEILDEYAKSEFGHSKEQLAKVYKEYKKLLEEYENANLDTASRQKELSLLEYEVNEIENADLKPGEDDEIEDAYRKFTNGKKIMEGVNGAYMLMNGDGDNASSLIAHALKCLNDVSSYDEKISELAGMLSEIDLLTEDFKRELSSYISDASFDEEHFYQVESRLNEINHLKSKYGNSVDQILEALEEKRARLDVLNDYDSYLDKLKKSLEKTEDELLDLTKQVSAIRQKEATKLEELIVTSLKELNFLDVNFEVNFEWMDSYTAKGRDDVEFYISTNPGQPLKPLGKVASGGELSRIMLAIKTVMARKDDIATLIFDEIDSGISGRTAQMVSEKLKSLSTDTQIICITHLPQIAAMADNHFLIEKAVADGATLSNIRPLDYEQSVDELARMLGGASITDAVIANAKEMKELAK